jgi:nifR3 family TIM-barrel protein
MVSSEALSRKNVKTKKILQRAENESIYAIQIFASSFESAVNSFREVEQFKPAIIDINCGCPVPKIIKSGAGCALMKNPEKIGEIIKALSEITDIPVTVKLRLGWDLENINFLTAAEIAIKNNVSLITLHPRTRTQGYSGKADWNKINELKKISTVPVIGSGDLFTAQACIDMLEQTCCDGVMVARGALGKPDIFYEVKILAEKNSLLAAEAKTPIINALKHLELAEKYLGKENAVREIKKHLCRYIKGIKNSTEIRSALVRCISTDEQRKILKNLFN